MAAAVGLSLTAALIVVAGTVAPVEPVTGPAVAQVHTITLPIHPDYVDQVRWTDTWGARRSGGRSHIGVDMMAPKMVPVVAANDAVITWGRFDNASGSIVRIKDTAGWEYQYIHINNDTPGTDDKQATCLQAFSQKLCDSLDSRGRLERGLEVSAGEVIGYLGDGGNAENTAPHLHFEVYQPDGAGGVVAVNPTPFVDAAKEGIGVDVQRVGPFANSRVAADEIFRRLEGRSARTDEQGLVSDAVSRGGLEVALAEIVDDNPSAAMIDRLYLAFFQRLPDEEGWDHWVEAMADGHRLEDIAEWFADGDEFTNRYRGINFGEFLDRLYSDVLGRQPDAEGKAYWQGLLRDGEVTRGTVVVYFTESAEMLTVAKHRSELTVIHRALGLPRPSQAEIEAWETVRATVELADAIGPILEGL